MDQFMKFLETLKSINPDNVLVLAMEGMPPESCCHLFTTNLKHWVVKIADTNFNGKPFRELLKEWNQDALHISTNPDYEQRDLDKIKWVQVNKDTWKKVAITNPELGKIIEDFDEVSEKYPVETFKILNYVLFFVASLRMLPPVAAVSPQ